MTDRELDWFDAWMTDYQRAVDSNDHPSAVRLQTILIERMVGDDAALQRLIARNRGLNDQMLDVRVTAPFLDAERGIKVRRGTWEQLRASDVVR